MTGWRAGPPRLTAPPGVRGAALLLPPKHMDRVLWASSCTYQGDDATAISTGR